MNKTVLLIWYFQENIYGIQNTSNPNASNGIQNCQSKSQEHLTCYGCVHEGYEHAATVMYT